MNRPFFPLIVVLGLALAGAAGCAPDRMVLEPFCICTMPDTCEFADTCDACLIGTPAFNPGLGYPLTLAIQLNNQSPNNEDLTVGRLNTNDAHVTGYTVTYTGGGPGSMTLYSGNQVVTAGASNVVWIAVAPAGAPAGRYTAEVSFIGYYDNGREFETEPFPVGLDVNPAYVFGCSGTDVDVCPGTGAQANHACGTP